ncbi:MAG: putative ribose-5-phosphate isomerase B [Candidatus Dojkabacteria bacterium]|nr:MAG: putative ribose-5-phosphate isomerase B [Candidatus Dojkabacteria bacterium]
MKIYIACDHGGFELKEDIVKFLKSKHDVEDLGPKDYDPTDDYPDYALKVAKRVASDKNSLGILICRSGNGMVITANKVKGSYAALCFTPEHAEKARNHDNANILVLPADYLNCCGGNCNCKKHLEIVKSFISSTFAGSNTRHGRRFSKVLTIEGENLK